MVAYIAWLMARDRKSTPLKSLQGKIWERGYRSGQLSSPVFTDVPPAFERWHKQQRTNHHLFFRQCAGPAAAVRAHGRGRLDALSFPLL
jgi:methionine salvage enolase-phosphatase E1